MCIPRQASKYVPAARVLLVRIRNEQSDLSKLSRRLKCSCAGARVSPTEVLVWLVRKECFLEVCEWTLSVPMGTVVVLFILNLERYRLSL